METGFFSQIAQEFSQIQGIDILTIGTLALLEGILSVDNALVLAILVRDLPKNLQKKALAYGIAGAVFFRVLALFLASYFMKIAFFKFIGGAYLLYLAMKHMFFFHKEEVHQSHPKVAASFWKTVVLVELTDLAFSIDSITTAVAMTDKLLIVWAGGIMGLICLRFMAQFFIKLLEKLPKLEDLAYQIVFFVGIKLTFDSFNIHIDHKSFWLTMGIISILGASILLRDHYLNKTQALFSDRLIARLKKGEMKVEEVLKLENIPNRVVHFLMERGTLEIKGTTP